MNEGLTLDDLSVPLRALRLLAANFGHLPAPVLNMTDVFPNRLNLSFHNGLYEFEAWREALGIEPESVTYGAQNGGRTWVLKASWKYAGATLELTGFGEAPAPENAGGAA